MHSTPKRFSQVFMTTIGLVFLIAALVLNHRHPHNAGVATLPKNNIYQLMLSATKQTEQTYNGASVESVASEPASTAYSTPAIIVEVRPAISVAANLCSSVDEQDFAPAKQAYDDAYTAYQTSTSDKSEAYQTYQAALLDSYKTYQALVTSSGCTPAQEAPIPKDT